MNLHPFCHPPPKDLATHPKIAPVSSPQPLLQAGTCSKRDGMTLWRSLNPGPRCPNSTQRPQAAGMRLLPSRIGQPDCGAVNPKQGTYSIGDRNRPWATWKVFREESNILTEFRGRGSQRGGRGAGNDVKSKRLERERTRHPRELHFQLVGPSHPRLPGC